MRRASSAPYPLWGGTQITSLCVTVGDASSDPNGGAALDCMCCWSRWAAQCRSCRLSRPARVTGPAGLAGQAPTV